MIFNDKQVNDYLGVLGADIKLLADNEQKNLTEISNKFNHNEALIKQLQNEISIFSQENSMRKSEIANIKEEIRDIRENLLRLVNLLKTPQIPQQGYPRAQNEMGYNQPMNRPQVRRTIPQEEIMPSEKEMINGEYGFCIRCKEDVLMRAIEKDLIHDENEGTFMKGYCNTCGGAIYKEIK